METPIYATPVLEGPDSDDYNQDEYYQATDSPNMAALLIQDDLVPCDKNEIYKNGKCVRKGQNSKNPSVDLSVFG